MRQPKQAVENYTNTCLVMGLVNLLWMFTALWAAWGLGAVILVGFLLNMAIDRLQNHRS